VILRDHAGNGSTRPDGVRQRRRRKTDDSRCGVVPIVGDLVVNALAETARQVRNETVDLH
jgi:hypothetical protein